MKANSLAGWKKLESASTAFDGEARHIAGLSVEIFEVEVGLAYRRRSFLNDMCSYPTRVML
jgi:hypothetical protein